MTLFRNLKDPHPLAPDDPGVEGLNNSLAIRRSTAQFGQALKRAGHDVTRDRASIEARRHLLAVLAEQGRG